MEWSHAYEGDKNVYITAICNLLNSERKQHQFGHLVRPTYNRPKLILKNRRRSIGKSKTITGRPHNHLTDFPNDTQSITKNIT